MEQTADVRAENRPVTQALAENAARLRWDTVPDGARQVAKQCLLDWIGVTLAGVSEPLVRMLTAQVVEDGGAAHATLLGQGGRKVSASQAALVNGAAGHALDFDDVLQPLRGHPTVPVMPAVLALAEKRGLDGKAVLQAFVAGVETESRVGELMGDTHYAKGWHSTGTNGTFGAASGCANMLELDEAGTAIALGIAGTQAAGLKSMFGTMCKPLHAGKAAQNGLLAASLAARGFTARPDVLDCEQGYADTQTAQASPARALAELGERFNIVDVLFKYHPACYGTHAPIEAARRIVANAQFDAARIERAEVRVDPKCLRMCNIQSPTTGLEGKFSLRYNVGLALAGRATGALAAYEDAAMSVGEVTAVRDKVRVEAVPQMEGHQAEVVVHLQGGLVLRERFDVGVPERDLAVQWDKLTAKFHALVDPIVGDARAREIVAMVRDFENAKRAADLLAACG